MPIDLNDTGLDAEFSFGPLTGNVIEEPPFHILTLGDFSGSADKGPLSERRPVEIDRDNFDEVLARMGTRISLDFDDGSVIDLEFNSLDDFHPDEIFRRVEMFDQLRGLRKKLNNSDTFNSAAYEARQLFGLKRDDVEPVSTDSEEPAADNLLDAILAQPEGGAAAPKRKPSGDLGRLVSELVRPHLVAIDEEKQSTLVGLVDTATGELMRKILHHRKFQALEGAWRGLFFLVRRTDTSTELKIFVLDISKEELAEDLKNPESLRDTRLYEIVVKDAVETEGGLPWAVIAGDYAFAPEVNDVAALMRISKIAAAAGASFISHMRPDVLGVHSLHEHSDPVEWKSVDETDAAKLWSALRGPAESQFLGMTIPRFIARLPYGSDTDPLDTFVFEEFESSPGHDSYLWSNGCFAVAQLLAQTFANYGWEMRGRLMQDIEGLPLHVYMHDGDKAFKACAEIPMTEEGVNKLIAAGFMPLVSYRSTDRIKLAMFQSIADPSTGLRGRWG